MTVVSITNTLGMNQLENRSFSFLKRLRKKKEVREHAGYLLTVACKIKLVDKKVELTKPERRELKLELIDKFQRHLQQFRTNNR